jgi:hypothetical protein
MPSHPVVAELVETYLTAVDAEAPGLVEGLYLEGSVALGDFRPHTSDVDFVAVTAQPPGAAEVAALRRVHARVREHRRRPFFDGVYLTPGDLRRGPVSTGGRPTSHEGRLRPDGGPHTPVTWHTLARHGVPCRGPAPAELGVWTDPAVLAAWQDRNLDEYWGRGLARARHLFSRPGLASLTDYGTAWTVTGVSRLHYTLGTGEITSKDGAGRHALTTFPGRWHRIVAEGLRIRRGQPRPSLYGSVLHRRRDVLAFATMVIADAHRVHAERTA